MNEQNLKQPMVEEKNIAQQQTQTIERVNLPGFGSLFGNVFSLMKNGFWRYVWINFLLSILMPVIILGILFGILYLAHADMTVILITSTILMAVIILLVCWKYPLMIHFTDVLARGERKIPFKKSEGYILGLLIFGIIFGIILNVGFLLLIIPGVIWFVRYFFTSYTYCLEEKRIFKAMGLASKYTKGFVFALLTRFLLFAVIYIVASLILSLLVGLVFPMAGISIFSLMAGSLTGTEAILAFLPVVLIFVLFYFIIFTLIDVFQIVYFYDVFNALRLIKQKAWSENREVSDGYSLGKKILVLIFVIAFAVLLIFGNSGLFTELFNSKKGNTELNQNNLYSGELGDFVKNVEEEKLKISDIEQIQVGLEQYYKNHNEYPPHDANIGDYECLDDQFEFLSADCPQAILSSLPDITHYNEIYYKSSTDNLSYRIDFELKEADGEYAVGSHFATPTGIDKEPNLNVDVNLDSDYDGLTNLEEIKWNTDPNNPDTDGDGYFDGAEVQSGYNPLDLGKMTAEQLNIKLEQ